VYYSFHTIAPQAGKIVTRFVGFENYEKLVKGLLPFWKTTVGFKLDKKVLENLEKTGLPEKVLQKLQALKNKKFQTEEEFLAVVEEQISKEEMVQYQKNIIQHARMLKDTGDRIFRMAVQHTLIWGAIGPTVEMLVATILAFIVYFKVPFHRFYRTAWFAPMLIVGVIAGMIWKWIFNYDWGLINVALRTFGLDELALNWLGRRDTPLWVVMFIHFWNTFGFSFVMLTAGLTQIEQEVVESARIDGASSVQVCQKILLPLLLPVFKTVLILSFMGKMRAFHIVWTVTQGGPMHLSETVATYVQKRAFGWGTIDLGYPTAIAVFWFGIVIIAVSLIDRWLKTRIAKYGV
jgi:multiple sugar transport system permease protein/raffinose/stachyose/melibiose transport system permease protein